MDPGEREETRAMNDSRKKTPTKAGKEANVAEKTSMRKRWSEASVSKMAAFWISLVAVVAVVIVGFTWGGWMTTGGAEELADAQASAAVIERLAPICVGQFNSDPDYEMKLDEMMALSSSQRSTYVREQGWATFSGEEEPDRKVANECAKLLTANVE